ncbi:factor-independent urate hydroxylase [Sinobaca sp. H24]|uniref:factor-independent urate hydroxylase n=1 Tax=Sinobaca sp. H24 TaxID=2923376 RepID=UPI002079DAE1|nr:urate oxidase [Sinobaca sp. H24]
METKIKKTEAVKHQNDQNRTMYYGKGDVFVYRTYASPLENIQPIPESSFTGRSNIIFAMDIQIALKGEAFFSSFSEGDNSKVIATDSMKNFILRHAGSFEGATMEEFLEYINGRFYETYSHIDGIVVSAVQKLFTETDIGDETGIRSSPLVFDEKERELPVASLETERTEENEHAIVSRQSGVKDLHLIKVKGSSFQGYIKDEYTTLPETTDRPLFIYLDINWIYEDSRDYLKNYVSSEQVAGIARTLFHELNSPSIQSLIYYIGLRVLERFPQLAEVSFESNNRTWELIVEETSSDEGRVFTDPRPPFGFQGFSLRRSDLKSYNQSEK